MALTSAAVLVSSVLLVMSASLSKTLRHKPPNECEWLAVTTYGDETIASQTVSDEQEVALHCRVRTMNSELEKTNFSIIQPQYTVKLKIECNSQLFLLSSLGTGTFQTLIDLKELTIDSCKLNSLGRESFRGLRQLRNLTVVTHNNDWTSVNMEVQSDTFLEELNMLERLDLSHNNIAKLPEGVFCSLQNLVYLNLTRNRLRHLELFHFGSSGQHKCGANLQVLDLSYNNFDSINSQVFSHLTNLQDLHLQGNVISVIGDHGFDGLSALSVLNVASNRLVNLAPELFADTRDLREMYLQNNTINVLAPGLFNELSRLLVLDLSENQLTEEWVNAATFTGLVRLVFLSMSNNNITKLDAMIFRDLYRLRSLRLDNNGVQYLPENVFSSLIDMRTLVLSSNKLTRIDQFTFDGLPSLNQLSLDNNQIQYIDPEALRNSTDLEYLHLNGNKLYDIPAVLNNIPNLKTLDLGYNQITDIFNTSFPAMSQLIGLKLLKNQISNVSKGVFDRLPELHLINLANNKIQKIEAGTFDNNTRLVAVRVDGNYLRDVGGLFSKLSNLVWLNISENFLEWFDYALIPTGLQWLDIHGNQITELGNHYELETQLTGFDASNNKLTEVTGSSIPDKVQNLYLSNNQISKIQSYAFFKKPNLTQVDLTGNRLKTLNPQSLRISTVPVGRTMPQFLVGNNPFVCDCSMQWLQAYSVEPDRNKPKLVDLETATCEVIYNRGESRVLLKEASEEQFLCQYDMECAKRSTCDCCDFDACDCKMICPTNCTCFHSVSSTSNVVDCSSAGYINRVPEKIPMNTTVLYLDGNTIKTLSTHTFLGRKILKVLYLNSSNVERVQNRTFHGLKELEVLHLDDNRISTLYGDEFYGLDKLKELYLNHNRITYINSTTFRFLQQLTILRLDHNRIAQFPVWRLSPTLTHLTLAENQWSCACDFVQQMKEFLQYAADAVVDAEQVRCLDHSGGYNINSDNGTVCGPTTPSSVEKPFNTSSNTIEGALNGGNLTAPTKTIIQRPDIQDYIPILIVSFSAVFFIIVAAMMVYVFRHEMKVWCHSRFGVRIFCKSTEFEMDERDKLFDAFVSYSSKDEAFVIEELAPILENGDPSYKLCLHYREFPAGGYISDTIVQAVESSKRTIMVLSENFIKSEWCRFEFKSAHHQVLRDKRKRLIVILLGEVPNKDLDPDIRLYLKTNSYLQWGDKHFWEKLKFALPDVPNNQRPKAINHKHHHHHHHHHRGVHNNYSRPLAIHI